MLVDGFKHWIGGKTSRTPSKTALFFMENRWFHVDVPWIYLENQDSSKFHCASAYLFHPFSVATAQVKIEINLRRMNLRTMRAKNWAQLGLCALWKHVKTIHATVSIYIYIYINIHIYIYPYGFQCMEQLRYVFQWSTWKSIQTVTLAGCTGPFKALGFAMQWESNAWLCRFGVPLEYDIIYINI